MTDIKEHIIDENNIFIYGSFDAPLVDGVISKLPSLIQAQSKQKDGSINIYIDSNGGEVRYLWNIVALLEQAKAKGIKIRTYALGSVFSAGSLLAIIGDERYISRNSQHILHLGSSTWQVYTDEQLERTKKYTKRHFNAIRDHYKRYAKVPNLEEKLKDDYYGVYGKTLITYKLADKFIEDA